MRSRAKPWPPASTSRPSGASPRLRRRRARRLRQGGAGRRTGPLCVRGRRRRPAPVSQSERAGLEHELEELATGGLRVLALARRTLAGPADALAGRPDEVERDLTLLGMVGLVDPPRPEVSAARAAASAAG